MVVCRSSSWAESVIGLLLRGAAVRVVMMSFLLFAAAVATIETFMAVVVVVSIGWHDVGNAAVVLECLRVDPSSRCCQIVNNVAEPIGQSSYSRSPGMIEHTTATEKLEFAGDG